MIGMAVVVRKRLLRRSSLCMIMRHGRLPNHGRRDCPSTSAIARQPGSQPATWMMYDPFDS
jgi:hypothetical protein